MTQVQDDRRLQIRKVIAAPRQRVFDAWVDPGLRKQWWSARPGMFCDVAEIDARPGGRYRINMKEPDGAREYVCVGEFLECDPPCKLVFTWSWEHADPAEPGTAAVDTVVTVELLEAAGGTEVIVTHEGFASRELRDEHAGGWSGCLESLSTALTR